MEWYKLLSSIIVLGAFAGALEMVRLAIKRKSARLPFSIVAGVCLYVMVFYSYMLVRVPVVDLFTATLGRIAVFLLVSGVVALGIILDQ
jgi:hypothetical protein